MNLYVASSWRNERQPEVVELLKKAGHYVYDFRQPTPGYNGFQWEVIDQMWATWTTGRFINALQHQTAEFGFTKDFDAMKTAEACVLVMPCGRSAHLEAGWFVGQGKPLIILLKKEDQCEPELMYKMATLVTDDINEVLETLLLAGGKPWKK